MESIQQVASEAFPMTTHPSSGYVPTEYTESGAVTESSGGVIAASSDGSNPTHDNAYSQDLSSITQDTVQYVASEPKPENGDTGVGNKVVEHKNTAEMPSNAIGYEATCVPDHTVSYDSINGNANELGSYQASGVTQNGIASNEEVTTAAVQHSDDVNSAEEERLWSTVRANCLDFNAWTALIEETERVAENNILKIRKVYDAFLAEFPLCFGYWKKYADHEGRLDSVDKVLEVYERAVQAVTYSVDIWLHYCMFAISTYDDPDIIRRIFERGLAFVGTDYLSYPLWDEYIRYEEAHQAWGFLALLYTRILENPIQQLDRYFNCFKELATSRPLSEIRTPEEAILMAADAQNHEGEAGLDGVEQSAQPATVGLTEAEELEKYIAAREEVYKNAKEFESKIINFETAIRRPYFHVRPLDDPELENWHNYLDFIEKEHDISKVIKLYERCLIACANYPEFWIRYVLCMEASGNMELAYNALTRATLVFVKKQPEIHIFAAKFKELNGDIMGARTEYQYLYSDVSLCLLEAIIKHANMEYRLGDKEAAYSIYEKVIAAEQEKQQSHILPMLLVQYSRFLYLVAGNLDKAREVLFGALDHLQLSKPVLEAAIHLETIQPHTKRVDYLDSLVEKFTSPNSDNPNTASTNDREEISSIFMEFLDLFGDALSIKKAESRHAKLFLRQKSSSVSKKRRAEDPLAPDRTKISKASTDAASSPSHSVTGAYPNAQNQWAAGYGQRVPSWPQNSQVQGQQWNSAYAPQAAYNAYGYANYAQPQVPVPTSAPQTAAYSSYPPAYPAQAYPQQNYAQPAAAVATVPQQQASAAQPYYTGYY